MIPGPNPNAGGVQGRSGALSGQQLLASFEALRCSGTLVLSQPQGSLLLLLGRGQLESSYRMGRYGSLEDPDQAFHFEGHDPAEVPQLGTAHPGSALTLLRALPIYAPPERCHPASTDLRTLIGRLQGEGFSGALSLAHRSEAGLALFLDGAIAAAMFERDAFVLEREGALRAIYRYSLQPGNPPYLLHPVDGDLVRCLLGMAEGLLPRAVDPARYSGLHATETGYRFYRNGVALLHVRAELLGSSRRFALGEIGQELHLPDDPPGWERQSYALTLRGRDALNPMTDLSMQFGERFGKSGRRILETLQEGTPIEEAAAQLGLELQELKPWLQRLEEDGLIRLKEDDEAQLSVRRPS